MLKTTFFYVFKKIFKKWKIYIVYSVILSLINILFILYQRFTMKTCLIDFYVYFLYILVTLWIAGYIIYLLFGIELGLNKSYINSNFFFSKYFIFYCMYSSIYYLLIATGLMLLIFPGIFLMVRYLYLPIVGMKESRLANECFKESSRLVKKTFVFNLLIAIISNIQVLLIFITIRKELALEMAAAVLTSFYVPISLSILVSAYIVLQNKKKSSNMLLSTERISDEKNDH